MAQVGGHNSSEVVLENAISSKLATIRHLLKETSSSLPRQSLILTLFRRGVVAATDR